MSSAQTFVSRREASPISFTRGRNTIRLEKRNIGSVSQIVIIGFLAVIFGLISAAEGTKATNLDYEISAVESEISNLSARRDDLAVEKARLTSVANAKNTTVAATMVEAAVTGYAAD